MNLRKRMKHILQTHFKWLYPLILKWLRRKSDIAIEDLASILLHRMNVRFGDTLIVHTSIAQMRLKDSAYEDILFLLQRMVGHRGNILMPTYVKTSHVLSSKPFRVNQTRGNVGIINELFRIAPNVKRSFHPWKPIAVWGNDADELISEHHLSEKAYDEHSPYFKAMSLNAKFIGIGVSYDHLSICHLVEDTHPELFPPIYGEVIHKSCFNAANDEITVPVRVILPEAQRSHAIKNIKHALTPEIASTFRFRRIKFCQVDTAALYKKLLEESRKGVTIYGEYSLKYTEMSLPE